jgi:hypothetical protein
MTEKQAIQRWTTDIYDFEVEERDDGDFVLFDDHEKIVLELTKQIKSLQDEVALLSGIVRDLENWDDGTKEVIE